MEDQELAMSESLTHEGSSNKAIGVDVMTMTYYPTTFVPREETKKGGIYIGEGCLGPKADICS